jgi:hypothetical protein
MQEGSTDRTRSLSTVHTPEESQQVVVLTVDVTCHHFITVDYNYFTKDFGLRHIKITDETVFFFELRVFVLIFCYEKSSF